MSMKLVAGLGSSVLLLATLGVAGCASHEKSMEQQLMEQEQMKKELMDDDKMMKDEKMMEEEKMMK